MLTTESTTLQTDWGGEGKKEKEKKTTNKPVGFDGVLVTHKQCSNNHKVLAIPSPTSNAFILRGRT